MSQKSNSLSQFWNELKRRRVIHVITVYASASFVIIELINNLAEPLNLPANLLTIVIIVLAIGFPLVIILSWLFDLTSKGVEKTKPLSEIEEGEKQEVPNAWKIATFVSFALIIVLVVLNLTGNLKHFKTGAIQSLVVLPFDNFTGDDQLEYFVSGMHSSLIGDIGKVSGLRVISSTSSNTYKDIDMPVPEIASELNVEAVVEATVMCLGDDSLCLQVRVISVFPEEKQLWIADYREEKSQILNLYNRITRQIANEVRVELTADEDRLLARDQTVDPEAYDAFLNGRYYWANLSKESLTKAMEYLEAGIEKDPDWAPLYAGMAQVWVGMQQMGYESPEIAGPRIFENISKALELDPEFPDLYFTIGVIAVWAEWNWDKGEKELLKALTVNPSDALSRMYYAHLLAIMERYDEALLQAKLAIELDPINPLMLALNGAVFICARDYEAALVQIDKALALSPEDEFIHNLMELAGFYCGEYEKAFASLGFILSRLGFEKGFFDNLDNIIKEDGYVSAYEEVLKQLEIKSQTGYIISPGDLASRFSLVNDLDRALEWLEKGFEIHDPNMPYILTGVGNFKQLYDNPRFIDIIEKMNLSLKQD